MEDRETMNSMAQYIDRYFNGPDGKKDTGFVLITFAFGDKGRCKCISNANREDVIVLLREQLARFQGGPDVSGTA